MPSRLAKTSGWIASHDNRTITDPREGDRIFYYAIYARRPRENRTVN